MFTIYGIKNCDSVKKALQLLDQNAALYEFVDFKRSPPTKENILEWKSFCGDWPVNKRGTTFRKLKAQWEGADEEQKLALIIENSSLIKRPVLTSPAGVLSLGIDEKFHAALNHFKASTSV